MPWWVQTSPSFVTVKLGHVFQCAGGAQLTVRGLMQEKLRLGESDEVAIEWMQQLIAESSSQVMAGFMEATHRLAQALR